MGITVTGTDATTGAAALTGFAGFAGFLLVTGKDLALAGVALADSAKALTVTFATGFAAAFEVTIASFTRALGAALTALFGTTLALDLDVGLIVAFGAAVALTGFLGAGLAVAWGTGFFTATLGWTAGLAIILDVGLTAVGGAVLDVALGVATALPLLTTPLAAILTLLAGLPVLADFAGFAFTACLLWEAASG